MATTVDPIRIGDTLEREYRIYNPKPENEWANPLVPEADLTDPANLTGITITFHLQDAGTLYSYATGSGVTVTPLTGTINIELEAAQTALLKTDLKAESYLKFVYSGGNEKTKYHQNERIVKRGVIL